MPKTSARRPAGVHQTSPDSGTFELTFSSRDDPTEFPSKMDLHQIGGGYGGHFWFGHTRNKDVRDGSMEFSGTWTLDRPLQQWARVLVHIPDHGAHTRQATYIVDPGVGLPKATDDPAAHPENGWVSLGVFEVNGVPSVTAVDRDRGRGLLHRQEEVDDPDDDVVVPAKDEDIAFDSGRVRPPGRQAPGHRRRARRLVRVR